MEAQTLSQLLASAEALTVAPTDYIYGVVGGASKAFKLSTLVNSLSLLTTGAAASAYQPLGQAGLLASNNTWTAQNTFAAGTIVANAPLTVTQAWNNAAVTFNALLVNVTSTASAAASTLMDLQVGGVSQFSVDKAGRIGAAKLASSGYAVQVGPSAEGLGLYYTGSGSYQMSLRANGADVFSVQGGSGMAFFGGSFALSSALDLILARDAANTLAQRNGVNTQTWRLYNTYTDSSNYKRFQIATGAGGTQIEDTYAGTGSSRYLELKTAGNSPIYFTVNATAGWQITGAGHILANFDNTYDIGASLATRPRHVYVAGNLSIGGAIGAGQNSSATTNLVLAASGTTWSSLRFVQGVAPTSPVDGDMWREDNTNTGLKVRINGVTKTVTLA